MKKTAFALVLPCVFAVLFASCHESPCDRNMRIDGLAMRHLVFFSVIVSQINSHRNAIRQSIFMFATILKKNTIKPQFFFTKQLFFVYL